MAEETTENGVTDTDIFKTLQKTTETLVEVLAAQKQQAPVYVQPAEPLPKSPNYLLYIGIAILILILFRKVRI